MATSPRGATRRQALQQFQNPVTTSDSKVTAVLDSTNTTETVQLAIQASKVSFQADGTLAGSVSFSIDGVNFVDPTTIGLSNAIVTYSTNVVKLVKVTWTSGSGQLHIAAV